MRDPEAIKIALVQKSVECMDGLGVSESELPKGPIFHYTTALGLKGILIDKKAIFATHTDYLNDISEIRYGISLAFEVIMELLSPIERIVQATIVETSHSPLAFWNSIPKDRQARWSFLTALTKYLRQKNKDTFVASFCEDPDLLSQWKGYGSQGGGYSIGLEVSKNQFSVGENNFGLFKVIYDKDIQKQLFTQMINGFVESLEATVPDDGYRLETMRVDPVFATHVNVALGMIRIAGMRFKHHKFKPEQEWRFYAESKDESLDPIDNLGFREANGILVPYIELPIVHESIKVTKVVCGPTLRRELSYQAATMLVKLSPFPDAEVESSDIPFIGK